MRGGAYPFQLQLTALYVWNSPLPAPALLPMTWYTRSGTFSTMYRSFSSKTSACGYVRPAYAGCRRRPGWLGWQRRLAITTTHLLLSSFSFFRSKLR